MRAALHHLFRVALTTAVCGLLTGAPAAQQTPKVTLDSNEAVFATLAAVNMCGYDQELGVSAPMRAQVREQIGKPISGSPPTRAAADAVCDFYRDHRQADSARELAQYVSLALNLSGPPFEVTTKEADLPPDAAYVLGLVPLLQRLNAAAGLHAIFQGHAGNYAALVERLHDPLSKMILATDVYLKLPISGYVGRRFVVYLEPMAAPGLVNARNYGADYFMVVSPDRGGSVRLQEIRHTYLHYVLDPLSAKRATAMKRLEPLLESVKAAPVDESYRRDVSLLVNESLIRAVEARTKFSGHTKEAEQARSREAQHAAEEGFILAPYFEERLAEFERGPESVAAAYPDWLHFIDVAQERKRAAGIHFASQAAPEVVRASKPAPSGLLEQADQRFTAGDLKGAAELANQALKQDPQQAGPALFLLAQIATRNQDVAGARSYFEQALAATREPRVVAWSHIYLGRICDLQQEREAALQHYRAALAAGDANPATKAAAERGLQQAYAPPVARRPADEGATREPR
jgi:tetratricopeptide (TPR) repeat protein